MDSIGRAERAKKASSRASIYSIGVTFVLEKGLDH